MEPRQILEILTYLLIATFSIIVGLGIAAVVMWAKNKSQGMEKDSKQAKDSDEKNATSTSINGLDKQSIFNFMEFDTVDDNMIIQKDGTRFLMVIECQGVNYDLMSSVEKTGVEEGFVQFLNTLRNPIQIYIQTRSVNLESSISAYKEKLKKVEDKYNRMRMQYIDMQESGEYTKEQLDKAFYELTKQSNLYEYGRDVINDTERMSLNKNVLNKKYYIIIPFYASELASNELDKSEIKSMAFSEIYTRAQALISSLSSCEVRARILRTNELIELLYMAYNREEAETFSLKRAMQAGYNELNTTAPDVLDKKMKAIDEYIEQQALEKAKTVVNEVISEKQLRVNKKEANMKDIIKQMAEAILKDNENYLGTEVMQEAIAKIEEEQTNEKKGGNEDGEKISNTARGRKSTTTIK